MPKTKSKFGKIKQDVLAIWNERVHTEEETSRLHKFLHFWVLVVKSFIRNRCPIRASALSYTTLLALIPMLAVAMSVTTGLLKKQGKDQIEHFINAFVSKVVPPAEEPNTNAPANLSLTNPAPETAQSVLSTNSTTALATNTPPSSGETNTVSSRLNSQRRGEMEEDARLTTAQKRVAAQIYGFIQNARSGAIAGVGILLLVYAAIRMLSQVESTFNDIWGVARGRSWWIRIVLYWTAITLGPLLLAGIVGLASGPHLQSTQKFLMKMPGIGAVTFKLLPLVLLWLAFTLFYKAVPNTKVRWKAALIGGLVGGTVWQVNNLFGFLYVSRVVSNSRIYGGLGLIPVFMAGVYLSWFILLFGAQVAYAYQNRTLYLQERLTESVNQRGREFVALRLMTCVGQRFQRGLPAPTSQQMSEELSIPSRLVQQVLQTLIAAHLVIEVSGLEPSYTPARPLEQINAHHILQAMRARGQELLTRNEPVREEVYGEFARIQEAEKQAATAITMLTLVHRADARLELAPPPAPEKEIEVSPALVPTKPAPPTPASPSSQPAEVVRTPEPEKPSAVKVAEAAEPTPSAPEKAAAAKPIAEPVSDEEREFPL